MHAQRDIVYSKSARLS